MNLLRESHCILATWQTFDVVSRELGEAEESQSTQTPFDVMSISR